MKTVEENIPGYPFTRKEAKQKAMLFQNSIKLLEWYHKGKEEEKDLGIFAGYNTKIDSIQIQ